MNPFSLVDTAVKEIVEREEKKILKIDKIKANKSMKIDSDRLFEKNLTYKINQNSLTGSIAAVDSGFDGRSLYSIDIVLVRSAGCIFHLKNSLLKNAEYYPSFFFFPKPYISSIALQKEDINCNKSLTRLKDEMGLARKIIEEHKPNFMLIDGSLVPQHADKPRSNSNLESFYKQVIAEFELLYEKAKENNCELVGCVKDSRGTRFVSMIKDLIKTKESYTEMFDSVFLDSFLEKKERTVSFHYTENVKDHPVLRDISKEWSENLYVSYMKPSEYDRVLRFEFFSDTGNLTEKADKISSVLYELSSSHKEFAFPSVLLEADLRARLNGRDIETIYDKILDKLGNSYKMQLRRNSKPL